MMKNLKRNWLVVSKLNKEFFEFWFEHLKVSKSYTLMGCFWPRYIIFELKKYRGVIFHDTRIDTNLKKTFHQSKRKSQNWDFHWVLLSKVQMYELEIYRGVMCYDNEEWYQIWKEVDLPAQNWHEEFNKFWPKHSKILHICTLMGCSWPKYKMFELTKYRGVTFVALEIDTKF